MRKSMIQKPRTQTKTAQQKPRTQTKTAQPVMVGTVTTTLMTELEMLMRELAERRVLADDLAAWFAKHPDMSEAFGEFQHTCVERRRLAARA